jgi:hypothetical protein
MKENSGGNYTSVMTNATGVFTLPVNLALGKYRIEASIENYGCAKGLPFSIIEQTPPKVNLYVSPETCLGSNDGAVDISAVDHLIAPVTYQLYKISSSNTDVCDRVPVTDKIGSSMTGLAPGKYCVTLRDSRAEAASCNCYEFEIFSGDYQTTPALLSGEKKLWPYEVTPKSALSASSNVLTCAANVTVLNGTPPYQFTWKREGERTRAIWDAAFMKYSRMKKTVEFLVLQETNTTGLSLATDLQSGTHKVYVKDQCATEPLVVTLVVPVPVRTYNLCFRWTTGDIEEEPASNSRHQH